MTGQRTSFTRGAALWLCLALLMTACAVPVPSQPPQPGTFAHVSLLARRGDLAGYRDALGKGSGLAARGRDLATVLDAEAWLVALGARRREYDLIAARHAMTDNDDEAMARSLGFGEQALRADMIDSASTIYFQRSTDQRWVRKTEAPLQWLEDLQPQHCRPPLLAWSMGFYARRDNAVQRLRLGHDGLRVIELCGGEELAPPPAPEAPAGPLVRSPAAALDQLVKRSPEFAPLRAGLTLTDRDLSSAIELEIAAVTPEGLLFEVRLGQNGGWFMIEARVTSREQRLGEARDAAMRRILTAARHGKARGRWPSSVEALPFSARDLTDPAASTGRAGWRRFEADAPAGFELFAPDNSDVAVAALDRRKDGLRRVLTHKDEFLWLAR